MKKILVAEDDVHIRFLVCDLLDLEHHPYQIKEAIDGNDTLHKAATFSPDLVILDVVMPGVGGLQVLREIRSNPALKKTKVILLTGKEISKEEKEGVLEADVYLRKPFSPLRLLECVEKTLEE